MINVWGRLRLNLGKILNFSCSIVTLAVRKTPFWPFISKYTIYIFLAINHLFDDSSWNLLAQTFSTTFIVSKYIVYSFWINRRFLFWDSHYRFVISDIKNPRVTVPKRIKAKSSMFQQKIMYSTAILDPSFRIFIRNQRPQKLPSNPS